MKFLGQGFHKLDHEQDRQTHKQTDRPSTPTILIHFVCNAIAVDVYIAVMLNDYAITS